ncbi:MAG TPA: alpha/beta fold hydrolase [Longimicrobium sp.]
MRARFEAWVASAGAAIETVSYPRAGGHARGCRLVPAGEARGRILLAHGAGNDALYPLLALCKPLLRAGWEIFAFDLDGHGRHSTTTFRVDGITGALAHAAERAEAGRPPLPLHLLGHSLGGALVLHALSGPGWERVVSAAVLSAPIRLRLGARSALGELRGFLRRATFAQREHYGVWGVVPAVGPLKRGAYPFRLEKAAPGFGYVAGVQALLAHLDLEEAAPRIRTPVLLVYSRGDALVPAEQGELLASRIPGSELEVLDGPTHWSVPFDEGAVARVAEWLA